MVDLHWCHGTGSRPATSFLTRPAMRNSPWRRIRRTEFVYHPHAKL